MLTARDYTNNEYPLLATKVHTSELNGQDDLELRIPQQKNNNLDLLSIDKLWEFDYNNITYKAVNVKRQTRGNSFNLNVRATPLFYWEFSKSIIHENHDGSHTANSAFRTVFEGSGFNFVLVDFSPSVEIEGFGKGANRLELFKRLLDRYNYEFIIQGRTVYMHHLIGNDTNFMYKYKLNASNVSSTTDATEYFTHIKGFGDFEEGEEDYFNNAKLKREYTHPLADVVGKWEGSPIVDGRVTQTSTLDEAMAQAVEESLAVTIEGTLHDVRKIYDIAVPVKGDRVWLHDERINLEQEIRLHKIVTTYDEKDNIIGCDVTFGSQSIGERHKANINSLSKRFADLLTGKLKLPIISLEQIGMDMINAIHAASSEIIFGDFGMMAISKSNPNHVFGVNSEGWYISQDGGRTPRTVATAQGIYADAIFAGTLWLTNDLNIEGIDGYLNIASQRFTMRNHDGTSSTVIEPGRLQMNDSEFELGGGASIHFTDPRNALYFNRDEQYSGLGFDIGSSGQRPLTYIGTSKNNINTNDEFWTGLIVSPSDAQTEDDTYSSMTSRRFVVRQTRLGDVGFLFDTSGSRGILRPWGGVTNRSYDLGSGNNYFDRIYAQSTRVNSSNYTMRSHHDSNRGFIFEVEYSQSSSSWMHFRGLNSGSSWSNPHYYALGASNAPFQRAFINAVTEGSDERLKDEITENDLGLDFINDILTRSYKLRDVGDYKNGVVAQEVVETLEKHNVEMDKQSIVSFDEMLGVEYTQFIAPLIKSIQELSNEVEALKNAERADDTE